jgi:hypothetical protein
VIDQTTVVSVLLPVTVALNCCVALRSTVGNAGVTAETDSFGAMVTVVEADLEGSALLLAVTVSVPLAGTVAEAVYKPLEVIEPKTALQVTLVSLLLPLAVVENSCCPPAVTVGLAGLMAATLSFEAIVNVVVLDLLVSAWLVAVTMTLVLVGKSFGAV